MNLLEYQALAARTAPTHLSPEDRRLNCAMGLVGEFGEFVDELKKKFHGHPEDLGRLRAELGDVMWYLAEAATIRDRPLQLPEFYVQPDSLFDIAEQCAKVARDISLDTNRGFKCFVAIERRQLVGHVRSLIESHGFTLEEVLEANIAKLRERYKDGFSEEASRERPAPGSAAEEAQMTIVSFGDMGDLGFLKREEP